MDYSLEFDNAAGLNGAGSETLATSFAYEEAFWCDKDTGVNFLAVVRYRLVRTRKGALKVRTYRNVEQFSNEGDLRNSLRVRRMNQLPKGKDAHKWVPPDIVEAVFNALHPEQEHLPCHSAKA